MASGSLGRYPGVLSSQLWEVSIIVSEVTLVQSRSMRCRGGVLICSHFPRQDSYRIGRNEIITSVFVLAQYESDLHSTVRVRAQTDKQADRHTDRQTDQHTDRQAGNHAGRQADRQADRHTGIHAKACTSMCMYVYTCMRMH